MTRTAAGLLLALSACAIGTGRSEVANLVVTVEADTDSVLLGDTVMFTVTALNATLTAVEFVAAECGPLDIEIRTARGEVVAPGIVGCEGAGGAVILAPGGRIATTAGWHGERALTPDTDPATEPPLLPGLYQARGLVRTSTGVLYGAPTPVRLVAP